MSAMLFLVSCDRKGQMVSLAEENIRQSVDYPKELKIIAVSEPDSAFGIHYFTQKEVKGMMLMMQKVSESIMKRTNNMTEFNPEDHYVMELAERQMRAMAGRVSGLDGKSRWTTRQGTRTDCPTRQNAGCSSIKTGKTSLILLKYLFPK